MHNDLFQDVNYDIQVLYSTFTTMIEESINEAAPKKLMIKNVVKENVNPLLHGGMTDMISLSVIEKHSLILKEKNTYENFFKYKKQEAITKKELKKIKKENFKKFIGSLYKNINLGYVHKIVKRFKNR